MRAMLLRAPDQQLTLSDLPIPEPTQGEVLIRVEVCAVCRTDLHLLDGELPNIPYPLVPGHQVVGTIAANPSADLPLGMRVGVPWLASTCGRCPYCNSERENLCDRARFTGYTQAGGFAEFLLADARYALPVDPHAPAGAIAPLLCGGLIGYRALRMCGDAERVGLFGFGAAAHILAQVLRHQGRPFYAFTRPGDDAAQAAAGALGARWVGGSDQPPPEQLDAAIIFAPVGALVPASLRAVCKGGTVVCGGIHMTDIPSFPYDILWGERKLVSVANLTRADGLRFLALAAEIPLETEINLYDLEDANQALADLRAGSFTGSAVLEVAVS